VCRVKKSPSSPSPAAQTTSSSSREPPHARQVGDGRRLQRGRLRRVDVRLEPELVDLGVAGRLIGTYGERLLQVRRGLHPLRVGVRFYPGRHPSPAAHCHRVTLLDLGRQPEERACLSPHPGAQIVGDTMPCNQEKAHLLQRRVDLGRDSKAPGLAPGTPGEKVDHGNRRCHGQLQCPGCGLEFFAHMTSQMPARRHEQSTAIQAAGRRDTGGPVSPAWSTAPGGASPGAGRGRARSIRVGPGPR
jgi:hypothetical protein